MKKVVTGILAILYLAVSSGVVLEVHYCMGKVAGVELYGGHNDQCGKCGMKEQKGGCCSDQLKVYKLEDVHKQVNSLGVAQKLFLATPTPVAVMDWQLLGVPTLNKVVLHPPPDIGAPALFIVNRVFRV
jgi:hypothetical protein